MQSARCFIDAGSVPGVVTADQDPSALLPLVHPSARWGVSAAPAPTGALWAGLRQTLHGLLTSGLANLKLVTQTWRQLLAFQAWAII